MTARKNKFGKAWMHEHLSDHWVHEAKRLGYRSRAAFKLLELVNGERLLRPGMRVADLGSAPGSWSQVLAAGVGGAGAVFAVDLLPMDPVPGVRFVQGDLTDDRVLAALEELLEGAPVDLVISDMAPNISGIGMVDQARSLRLAEIAVDFADRWLKPGGDLVIKAFQGGGLQELQRALSMRYRKVTIRKPSASRDRSRELFLVARGHAGVTG